MNLIPSNNEAQPAEGLAVVVLAAGQGTRMKSALPKVMHDVAGKPMIARVLDTVAQLDPTKIIVVVGHGADQLESTLAEGTWADRLETVAQTEQRGTGHAVRQCESALASAIRSGEIKTVLVVYGDVPLVTSKTLSSLVSASQDASASVMTFLPENTKGYGRIVRQDDGSLARIVEEKDATDEEKAIKEANAGSASYDAGLLFPCLDKLTPSNKQGEYYLTDVIGMLVEEGKTVIPVVCENEHETLGVDSRDKLAQVNAYARDIINDHWMSEGVTILDPSSTWIDPEVRLNTDVTVLPGTMLKGNTTIGTGSIIGPGVIVRNSTIGTDSTVQYGVLANSTVGNGVSVGPYFSLREGSVLKDGSKVGTFVETKNTVVGESSKIPHLSYFGDAELGTGVNVGAGSITCNYDGANKHKTKIEDGVFIGSDTMLVAPVNLGKDSGTGAGSVVTQDVEDGDLVAGVPAVRLRKRNNKNDLEEN